MESLSFIVIGDPHFKTDNIPEVNLFMERLFDLIDTKCPDFIVVLGDLLHTHERLHTTALNKAYEFIHELRNRAKTYVLVGNHDMCNNQQFLTENHWMNGMKEWDNVVVVDKVHELKVDRYASLHSATFASQKLHSQNECYQFIFCPYVPNGRFIEALDTLTDSKWTTADCIFAHQEFHGCKMNAITSVEGDRWKETYPHVVSGHIHGKQRLQSNIYYTGSAMQHAFGESTKNIIAVLTFEDNEPYKLEEIDLKLPRKRIVHASVEDMDEYTPEEETKDKVKITISGVYDQFKAFKKTKKYKELVKKGTKVVFKPKKIKSTDDAPPEVENESDFKVILSSLINMTKDPFLFQVHEHVVNGKTISEDDVMFIS